MSAKIQAHFRWLIPAGIIAILVLVVFSQNGKVVSATVSPEVLVKDQPQEVTVSVAVKPGLFVAPAIKAILVGPGKDFNIFTGQKTTLGWLSKQGRDSQGNYIYKGAFTINHPVAETVQVQLSNMFGRSLLPNVNPPLMRLAISTRQYLLPPDPGEAGKATLAGIDSDQDGLRDDVQREIFFLAPQSEKVRAALMRYAMLKQLESSVSNRSEEESYKTVEQIFDSLACLYALDTSVKYNPTDGQLTKIISDRVLNTAMRKMTEHNNQLKAGTHLIGQNNISRCSFDPNSFSD